MSHIAVPAREAAPAASQPLLDAVEKQLGVVPNLFRLVALSPAALQGFLGLSGALGKALDVRMRERIAIAVAQVNGCDYCLSAHTYLGLNLAKIDDAEIALNRRGASSDPKANAAVAFARKVARKSRTRRRSRASGGYAQLWLYGCAGRRDHRRGGRKRLHQHAQSSSLARRSTSPSCLPPKRPEAAGCRREWPADSRLF